MKLHRDAKSTPASRLRMVQRGAARRLAVSSPPVRDEARQRDRPDAVHVRLLRVSVTAGTSAVRQGTAFVTFNPIADFGLYSGVLRSEIRAARQH